MDLQISFQQRESKRGKTGEIGRKSSPRVMKRENKKEREAERERKG